MLRSLTQGLLGVHLSSRVVFVAPGDVQSVYAGPRRYGGCVGDLTVWVSSVVGVAPRLLFFLGGFADSEVQGVGDVSQQQIGLIEC